MVKTVRTYKEFLNAIKDLNAYNTYMSYTYLKVFCESHPEFEKTFRAFIVFGNSGEVIGALPIYKRKIGFVILGYRYSNYLGYVCNKDNIKIVNDEVTDYLKKSKEKYVINYFDINSSDGLFELLDFDKNNKKSFLYGCPFSDVSINSEDYFVRQIEKAKKRSELKKFYRKICELGTIEIYNIDDKESWNKYSYLFPQVFEIHKRRFCHTYIPDNLCMYKNSAYYSTMFEALAKEGKAYISIMTLDDKVISFVCTTVSGKVVQDWMPAFDPAFSKYSLGTVHLLKIFEYVCNSEKYETFDFSKGTSVYKDRWSNGETYNYAFACKFDNSVLSNIKQCLILIPYNIKTTLRKKGYIGKIKNFIVKLRGDSKNSEPNIKIVNCQEKDSINNWEIFSYSSIEKYNEIIKTALLKEYYSSKYEEFAVSENTVYTYSSNNKTLI